MKKIITTVALFLVFINCYSQQNKKQQVLSHCGNILPDTLVKLSSKSILDIREWLTLNGWIPFKSSFEKSPKYKWAYDYHPNDQETNALNHVRIFIYPKLDTEPNGDPFCVALQVTMPESPAVFTKSAIDCGFKRTSLKQDDTTNNLRYSKVLGENLVELIIGSEYPSDKNLLALPMHSLTLFKY